MRTLLLGHITEDRFVDRCALGGPTSFAAKVAAIAGQETRLLTSAPVEFPYWDELNALPDLAIENIESDQATTFELSFKNGVRHLKLLSRAKPLDKTNAALSDYAPDLVFFGPVYNEIDFGLFEFYANSCVICGLQGFLRRTDELGFVRASRSSFEALKNVPATLLSLSTQDHPDAQEIAKALSANSVVALTDGKNGAQIFESPSKSHFVPALECTEVDSTGAGDAFLFRLGLGLAQGEHLLNAAAAAALVASHVVRGPGLGNLSSQTFS